MVHVVFAHTCINRGCKEMFRLDRYFVILHKPTAFYIVLLFLTQRSKFQMLIVLIDGLIRLLNAIRRGNCSVPYSTDMCVLFPGCLFLCLPVHPTVSCGYGCVEETDNSI